MDARRLQQMFSDLIRPLQQRVLMSISRAVIKTVTDTAGVQLVKVELLQGEFRENIERFQEFGFSSNPPADSEAVAVFVGGNREHGIIIGCDNRATRFKSLASGEMAIYTDDGTHIHLKKGGEVLVKAATKLTVDVPNATFKGNIKVEGNVVADGGVNAASVSTPGAVSAGSVTATGAITGATVIAGGVNTGSEIGAIKSGYNGHTHPETGITTGTPSPTIP